MRATLALALGLSLAACEHSQPFAVQEPDPLGPAGTELPVRLTFNVGPDEMPAATADFIVYSTLDPGRSDGDRCLAYLPPTGGTRLRTTCPGGALPDDRQDALLQPAPGPNNQMAFVWEQSAIGARAPGIRRLRTASIGDVDDPQLDINVLFQLEDGTRILAVRQLQWASTGLLWFVAGEDYLDTNNGVDTVFVPLALGTVNPEGGAFAPIPGTDSAYTYGVAPDGSAWFLRATDRRQLLRVDPNVGEVAVLGHFDVDVETLGVVGGLPVAFGTRIGSSGNVEAVVQWLGTETGTPAGEIDAPGVVRDIVGVPGMPRFVLGLEAGSATDLWLYTLP